MQQNFVPFIASLLLTQHLIRFSKINNLPQWLSWFNYTRYFAVFLFFAGFIFSSSALIPWFWDILLISFLVFAFQQNELRPLRMFLFAFVPYVGVATFNDLADLIVHNFYNNYYNYFDTAEKLTVIWLAAILFSHYRQNKIVEKERIQRQKEDEINRAIAQRKVELEGLVAERTVELTRQKEELEQTLEELKTTQTQLIHAEKMASLGELTAGIAHEIQNPLNFVNNFSEVNSELIDEMKEELSNGNTDEAVAIANDIKQNLAKIIHHGKRADSIVKGMLQHSRSNSGIKEPVDLNLLCDEYMRLAYHGLRAKDKSFNASLKTDFDESIGKINVVPQEMGRVILNLLTNAFYAVNEKKKIKTSTPIEAGIKSAQPNYEPKVTIKTSFIAHSGGQKGAVQISVTDNGNGIPLEVQDKIFQPFFTTKPSGKGTGLGLSLSYEIVTKAHGGELKVESKPGEGATFTIILPVETVKN